MKKHILLVLKTLINNNACVEASRTKQIKYNIIAIVFAILGVFLAVLPTGVNSFKKSGSDWMNTSYVYNMDTAIYNFCNRAKTNGITLTIKEDEKKSRYLESTNWTQDNVGKYTPRQAEAGKEGEKKKYDIENFTGLIPYVFTSKIGDEENIRVLEVYDFTKLDDKTFISYATDILNNLNPTITGEEKDRWMEWTLNDDGSKKAKVSRSNSVLFFGKNSLYVYSFRYGTTSSVGAMGGDYQHSTVGRELISEYYVENKPTETFNKWKPFFNEAYINVRWSSSWRTIGIMLGVDFGVLLFMGLMVFILTRGKNNPFRIYSFWDSQKIAYYASFSPSILALAFGFLMSQMAMMFYVLALGIRVMWLSMRTLRPEGAMQK